MGDTPEKRCVKFQDFAFDFLNITYNTKTQAVALWNKYQIFVYEKLTYEFLKKKSTWTFTSDFIIVKVVITEHFIIFLDDCGHLHISQLKIKIKNVPHSFMKRERLIVGMSYNEEAAHSLFILQKNGSGLDFCIHRIANELPLLSRAKLAHKDIKSLSITARYDNVLFRTYPLIEKHFNHIKERIDKKNLLWSKQILLVLSFDYLTLYVALICPNKRDQTVNLVKLYTCVSLITDISFVHRSDLHLIVGLASGTLINIPLYGDLSVAEPIHLNKAIAKFVCYDETVIYSDGITVWKSKQTYNADERTLTEFVVKYVKDFVMVNGKLVCLTYSKLIYFLQIDNDPCYATALVTHEYCPTRQVLTSDTCTSELTDKIKKCKKLDQLVEKEKLYITAITLSNRPDITKDLIEYKVTVYDTYEDILNENIHFSITEDIAEYFDTHTTFFLIKINKSSTIEDEHIDVISHLLGTVQIHITFLFKKKVLKTTSLKVNNDLKELLFVVIPLKTHELNLTDLTVNFNITSPVPGALNERETLWANLHYNTVVITPEQFIKTNYGTSNSEVGHLKDAKKPIKQLILETARNHHQHLFNINLLHKTDEISWHFYVKLPENFSIIFHICEQHLENLNKTKLEYIHNEINTSEFQNGRATLCWWIGNEKVYLIIQKSSFVTNDKYHHKYTLKVMSCNAHVALTIRNMFAELVYGDQIFTHEDVDNDIMEFIEFQEKAFRMCTLDDASAKEFVRFYHRYQDTIMRYIFF